ncbi:cholinesterase-like [Crotalus adamanteus]|uniref:Carboxylic ester hydrolase n=1 Tax=Crotalus adamanteus TaxID=8729 RepID=A0AAW1BVN2_CROAD
MGFITGTASLDIYNGATLSATEKVIVASMNYRLGALGFLSLPPYAPGNVGLWDQHLALKWLKENIAVFGGDPAQLTLVGQSAGAALVGCHLLSPLSQPLFARAVLQSGVPNAIWPWKTPQEARTDAIMLSKEVGCARDNDSAVVSCLQEIGIEQKNFTSLTLINSLTTDGDFLPGEVPNLLDTAILQGKPVLTGVTDDEGHHPSGSGWPEWVGTPHGAEIPYVFGTMASATNQSITEAEEALSRQTMRYWAQFVRGGTPTRPETDEQHPSSNSCHLSHSVISWLRFLQMPCHHRNLQKTSIMNWEVEPGIWNMTCETKNI